MPAHPENSNNANLASNSSPTTANPAIAQRWREDALEAKRELSRSADLRDNEANRPVYHASFELIDYYLRRTSRWTQETYRKRYSDAWRSYSNSQPDIPQPESGSSPSEVNQITRGTRKKLEVSFLDYLTRVQESGEPVEKQLYRLEDLISTSGHFFNLIEESRSDPPVVHEQSSDEEANDLYDTETPKEAFLDYFYSQHPTSDAIRSLADEYYLVVTHLEQREQEKRSAVKCLSSTFRML
ncbi:hypothetical protein V866_005569 [Kwoniella sp. B9012]